MKFTNTRKTRQTTADITAKHPILEQAETVIRKAKESGIQLFIKAVCNDGNKRYL